MIHFKDLLESEENVIASLIPINKDMYNLKNIYFQGIPFKQNI